ncbi:MAG: TonB family protein [Pyrinomonadaceae bacterium]
MSKRILALYLASIFVATASTPAAQVVSPAKSSDTAQQELDEATRQHSLAVALFDQKKYDEALTAAKSAVDLRERAEGRDSTLLAGDLYLLASYYQFTGKSDQAEPLYRRAISIWEKAKKFAYPSEHIIALERYACLKRADRQDEEAGKFGSRASELIARLYKDDDAKHTEQKVDRPKEHGTVIVEVTVNESGRVILACAQSGPELLREAGVTAAYRARFSPTIQNGAAVRVRGTISYKFTLQ